jgi:hypothetical protein
MFISKNSKCLSGSLILASILFCDYSAVAETRVLNIASSHILAVTAGEWIESYLGRADLNAIAMNRANEACIRMGFGNISRYSVNLDATSVTNPVTFNGFVIHPYIFIEIACQEYVAWPELLNSLNHVAQSVQMPNATPACQVNSVSSPNSTNDDARLIQIFNDTGVQLSDRLEAFGKLAGKGIRELHRIYDASKIDDGTPERRLILNHSVQSVRDPRAKHMLNLWFEYLIDEEQFQMEEKAESIRILNQPSLPLAERLEAFSEIKGSLNELFEIYNASKIDDGTPERRSALINAARSIGDPQAKYMLKNWFEHLMWKTKLQEEEN